MVSSDLTLEEAVIHLVDGYRFTGLMAWDDPPPPDMKRPKYVATSLQQMIDVGINAPAVKLLAESFNDKPGRFKDETLMLVGRSHRDTPVYMLISTRAPSGHQFRDWPT